ncbi:MAG: multifunctional CCA addition/repair protein [Porticoccaceae bacterium]|jgi:tRNA nucleotidyltransferase (CCA-adding enzyme)|nr:multifunctional CCA addition/repair protein [Porticoccaceae bacterium]HLS98874.1 multifunctional CCA addition/repair protein [Porticoccaceae bacterium]
MEIYLVGGAVRDGLLGFPHSERDWVVVGATPEQMGARGFRPVGRDFPVFIHPDTGEEYALARTERKTGKGYKGFSFFAGPEVSLEDDLIRRDLTINAMARAADGTLIDPHGGQQDLDARVLRHVSDAFAEDPLRVLRVARFAARYHHLGFTIAPETLALMGQLAASDELSHLTPERVWAETHKALGEASPWIYIEVLRQCGALAVLLPEVERLFGIPQRADYHPEVDTGIHTLMTLEQAARLSADPRVRFAALVHDLGKGTTSADILPRHIGHEERGIPLVNALCDRWRIPNDFRELAIPVTRLHLLCHKVFELRPVTVLRIFKAADAFRKPERFEAFLLAVEADARGRLGYEDMDYAQGRWLRELHRHLGALSPRDFVAQGLKGAAIGEALDRRREGEIRRLRESQPAHFDVRDNHGN